MGVPASIEAGQFSQISAGSVSPCCCLVKGRSNSIKSPARRSSRLNREEGSCLACHQSENGPRWGSSRWSAVIGCQSHTGLIHSGWPSLRAPLLRHSDNHGRICDLFGHALHDEVELVSGNAQRAPRVARQIPPFTGQLSGLEPESAIEPERTDTCHMRASVPVDRRQPAGVSVGPPSPRSLGYPLGETILDNGPIDDWQLIEVGKIRRFHDGTTNPTMEIHRLYVDDLSSRTRRTGRRLGALLYADPRQIVIDPQSRVTSGLPKDRANSVRCWGLAVSTRPASRRRDSMTTDSASLSIKGLAFDTRPTIGT
jgi:hypothetical protein